MLIDFTLAILMVIAIIKGYRRGFIIAVFSVVAFIIGLAAAVKLSAIVAGYLQHTVNISDRWLPFIAFAMVFFTVVVLVKIGARFIEKAFQAAMLGWLNRLGGILLYAVLYLIIYSIFFFYAEKLLLIKPETIEASQTYSYIKPWGPAVIDNFGKLIPIFKNMFAELGEFFDSLSNKISH